MVSTHAALLTTSLVANEWSRAAVHCGALCEAYLRIYGATHPLLGLQLFTLGDILVSRLRRKQEGAPYLQAARNILLVTHGEDASLVRRLAAFMR
jgi:SET and MYND domain-containing protein